MDAGGGWTGDNGENSEQERQAVVKLKFKHGGTEDTEVRQKQTGI
jgi:hypothetical protein